MTEVGFHAKPPTPFELLSKYSAKPWYYSTARNDTLLSCLQATKNYLDLFLTFSNEVILNLGLLEYLRLVYAILVLTSFSNGCDAPTVDHEYMRNAANLSYYLDVLSSRTGSMITYTGSEENRDYMSYLRCKLQTNSWFSSNSEKSQFAECVLPNSGNKGFMDILSNSEGTCFDELTLSSKRMEGNAGTENLVSQPWPFVMSDFHLNAVHPTTMT